VFLWFSDILNLEKTALLMQATPVEGIDSVKNNVHRATNKLVSGLSIAVKGA